MDIGVGAAQLLQLAAMLEEESNANREEEGVGVDKVMIKYKAWVVNG